MANRLLPGSAIILVAAYHVIHILIDGTSAYPRSNVHIQRYLSLTRRHTTKDKANPSFLVVLLRTLYSI